jgi:hypothetical protein
MCQNGAPGAAARSARASPMKTLVFCTSFAQSDDVWNYRYGKWLAHVSRSPLRADQILLVDDGSPVLPAFPSAVALPGAELPEDCPESRIVLVRFAPQLGRPSVFDYPGWWRSFLYVARYAEQYGFDKVVHVESDTYLLSSQLHDYVNRLERGWVTFWCPLSGLPETCIQVICPDQLHNYLALADKPLAEFAGQAAELVLPFTLVESDFKGDRYGEYRAELPRDADYASQVPWSTEAWAGPPPAPRSVLSLSVGDSALPPHPTLYPQDAWQPASSASCAQVADLPRLLQSQAEGSLDALQLTLPAAAAKAALPIGSIRRVLAVNGELALNLRPGGNPEKITALGRSLHEQGFAGVATDCLETRGDWILAISAHNTLGDLLGRERLSLRLRHLAFDWRHRSASAAPAAGA